MRVEMRVESESWIPGSPLSKEPNAMTSRRWIVVISRTRVPNLWDLIIGRRTSTEYVTFHWNGWFEYNSKLWWADGDEADVPEDLAREVRIIMSARNEEAKRQKQADLLARQWRSAPVLPEVRLLEGQE